MLCCLKTLVLGVLPVFFSGQSLQTGLAGTLIVPGLYSATSSTWLHGWEPPQPRKWKDGSDIPLSLFLLHTQVIFIIYPRQFLTMWLAGHWWSGLNAECYFFFFPESKFHFCHQQWGQAWSSWEAPCHVQHVQTTVFKQKGNISYWAKIGRTVVQNIWNNTNRGTQIRNPEKLDWSRNAHLKNFMFGFCQTCEGFWQSRRADVPAERWLRNPGDNRGAIFLFSARFQCCWCTGD